MMTAQEHQQPSPRIVGATTSSVNGEGCNGGLNGGAPRPECSHVKALAAANGVERGLGTGEDASQPVGSPHDTTTVTNGGWGADIMALWGGGWQEFMDEDAEHVGEAFEVSVMRGTVGENEREDEIKQVQRGLEAGSTEQQSQNGQQNKAKKVTAKGLLSNFVLSVIGSTTLGVTAQMPDTGWFLGPGLLLMGCLVVTENTRLVAESIETIEARGGSNVVAYPDFAFEVIGIWGRRIASVTSVSALIGMTCAALILEAHNMNFVLPIHWPWFGGRDKGDKWWALFLLPITVIGVFGNPARLLKKSAALGPFICVMTVLLAWYGAASSISAAADIPQHCGPPRSFLPGTDSGVLGIAEAASYTFYSFAVIVTVPSMRSQMKDPRKTVPATSAAYLICFLMFLPIMMLGYAGFGRYAPENLISGMRIERPAGWWAHERPFEGGRTSAAGALLAFVVTLNLFLTEAIYLPCTIFAIEASCPQLFRHGPSWAPRMMRVSYIVFRFVVATSIESFVALSSLVSSLFCIFNNVIFPVLAFHKLGVKQVSGWRKASHVVIVLYGMLVLVFGSAASIQKLTASDGELMQRSSLRAGLAEACASAYAAVAGSAGSS